MKTQYVGKRLRQPLREHIRQILDGNLAEIDVEPVDPVDVGVGRRVVEHRGHDRQKMVDDQGAQRLALRHGQRPRRKGQVEVERSDPMARLHR
ncbi:hypothetical protein RO07_13745 [Pandoraea pulmonicola]|uniref:Uncharacterized protein n=1 Tax=Pandoraea pulmonicola TaxID=93221 RepID=A0ABM5S0M7_PANPU|nr:hypothetical protein RO07_13745 [Pandoraea pulmonicola]